MLCIFHQNHRWGFAQPWNVSIFRAVSAPGAGNSVHLMPWHKESRHTVLSPSAALLAQEVSAIPTFWYQQFSSGTAPLQAAATCTAPCLCTGFHSSYCQSSNTPRDHLIPRVSHAFLALSAGTTRQRVVASGSQQSHWLYGKRGCVPYRLLVLQSLFPHWPTLPHSHSQDCARQAEHREPVQELWGKAQLSHCLDSLVKGLDFQLTTVLKEKKNKRDMWTQWSHRKLQRQTGRLSRAWVVPGRAQGNFDSNWQFERGGEREISSKPEEMLRENTPEISSGMP